MRPKGARICSVIARVKPVIPGEKSVIARVKPVIPGEKSVIPGEKSVIPGSTGNP